MKSIIKLLIIVAVGIAISLLPVPNGLSYQAWTYFALFFAVILGVIFEPLPSAFIGLVGLVIACLLKIGPEVEAGAIVETKTVLKWGLSGFSNTTVWLIFVAFMFAMGYEKSGLGKRISLILVKKMGKKTLFLGYAIMLSDLLLAPFMPSNTARSGGTIFPIVKNIPPIYDSSPTNEPRKIGAYLSWVALATTCVTSSLFYTALAPNILAMSLVEQANLFLPSWEQWFIGFLPIGVILLSLIPVITFFVYPPTLKSSPDTPKWAKAELVKMGRISKNEILMGCFAIVALVLWIFGKQIGIHTTLTALLVLCLMVLSGIISWNDILSNKAAWNVLVWFGALVTLAGGLSNVGFLNWFAQIMTTFVSGYSPFAILVFLVLVFYFIHYLFASTTAHVTALLSLFLITATSVSGIDLTLYIYLILYSIGLMGIFTPYATGPGPVWFSLGYIPSKTFWTLGALFGLIFIIALLGIGIPWLNIMSFFVQ